MNGIVIVTSLVSCNYRMVIVVTDLPRVVCVPTRTGHLRGQRGVAPGFLSWVCVVLAEGCLEWC